MRKKRLWWFPTRTHWRDRMSEKGMSKEPLLQQLLPYLQRWIPLLRQKWKSDSTLDVVHHATEFKRSCCSTNAAHNEDEFSEYVRHVAAQLWKLLLFSALWFQKLFTEERTICVTGTAGSNYRRLVQEAISPQIRSPAYPVPSQMFHVLRVDHTVLLAHPHYQKVSTCGIVGITKMLITQNLH